MNRCCFDRYRDEAVAHWVGVGIDQLEDPGRITEPGLANLFHGCLRTPGRNT
jgi:hypothetical protein